MAPNDSIHLLKADAHVHVFKIMLSLFSIVHYPHTPQIVEFRRSKELINKISTTKYKGVAMKVLIALAICLSMIFYAGVTLSESDEICCSWVNTKYENGKPPQKIAFHYDGTFATYNNRESDVALSRGTFQIVKKWSDADGYLWYKIIMNDSVQGKKYKLARVTSDGKKLEFISKTDSYPTEIKADSSGYCNYMRASMNY